MKAKKYWILTAILGICASAIWAVDKIESPTSSQATYIFDKKDTLKGMQGVGVTVEELRPGIERYGLTRQQIQTDVELKLRQNGIKVLSDKECVSAIESPSLYINVNAEMREETESTSHLVVFNIFLQVNQLVYLTRDPTKICFATTWSTGTTGSVGSEKIETIRDAVKDEVDKFINDYLAVNPKN